MTQESGPRVFVSHSSNDRSIVDSFLRLLLLSITGLRRKQIRFTSDAATGLSPGDWIAPQLIEDIRGCSCFVAVVSESFLSSIYCLCELGVRLGVPGSKVIAVYLPGIDPPTLGGVFAQMHLSPLTVENSVQEIVKQIAGASTEWELQLVVDDLRRFCADAAVHPQNPIERWRKSLVQIEEGQVFLNGYGLGRKPVRRTLFQDFHPDKANVQPVQYLWADPRRGDSIRAQLMPASEPAASFLRMHFQHKPNSFGCNFAVRPLNREAVITGGARSIVIKARVAAESEVAEIGIKLRIVNGYLQHWENGVAQVLRISGNEFRDYSLDLDPACWAIFRSDGTGDAGPSYPDFSIVASLVLSLGGYETLSPEPTSADGVLDLCSIEIR